ncbi:hypothetical protein [Paracoccus sp. (in: a-proteobacteria)]|uniref:hypothetical protein n=1 Tax=Paracoccus sp. TaxID=267 RepID=UPI002897A4E5|nr:hypothetical protein [Paracoccus sp. (in: a-proteobacteria)]
MSDDHKTPFLRQIWLRLLATAGVAAAILLSWWWKVDEARTPEVITVASLGQAIDLGRTIITPQAFHLRGSDPATLVMSARIENVTGESQTTLFGSPAHPPKVMIDGVALPEPDLVLIRDQQPLRQLHPRMPEQIEMIWPAPPDWQPKEVQILFDKQIFKLRDNLYGQASWLGFLPAAQMHIRPQIE